MSTTGHENEAINVQGLKASLQKFKDEYTTDVAYLEEGESSAVIADFDPQTDTVWKKAQTLSNAEKSQVKTNLGLPQEIYSKTEVNNLITTPNQQYVTVATYASLPASGSADTIYRVSNYNGSTSQVDSTMYSEYAWNGTDYEFLCVKSQIGEVFDITAYNSNTKYANLSAALGTNGVNIPEGLRKGGMSVKFVQNSDNKYVQYMLLTPSFSINENDWIGLRINPDKSCNLFDKYAVVHGYYGTHGIIYEESDTYWCSDFIEVEEGQLYERNKSTDLLVYAYDANKQPVAVDGTKVYWQTNFESTTIPSGVKYIRVVFRPRDIDVEMVYNQSLRPTEYIEYTAPFILDNKIDVVLKNLAMINSADNPNSQIQLSLVQKQTLNNVESYKKLAEFLIPNATKTQTGLFNANDKKKLDALNTSSLTIGTYQGATSFTLDFTAKTLSVNARNFIISGKAIVVFRNDVETYTTAFIGSSASADRVAYIIFHKEDNKLYLVDFQSISSYPEYDNDGGVVNIYLGSIIKMGNTWSIGFHFGHIIINGKDYYGSYTPDFVFPITPEKTSFIEDVISGINLFNKKTIVHGYYSTNGTTFTESDSYWCSDFIEVEEGQLYERNYGKSYLVYAYDANKQTVAVDGNKVYWQGAFEETAIPTGVKYIRVVFQPSKIEDEMVYNQTMRPEEYVPYSYKQLDSDIRVTTDDYSPISNNIGTSDVGNLSYQEIDDTDYSQIIMYGQSLSMGWEAPEAITESAIPGVFMVGDKVSIGHGNNGQNVLNPLISTTATNCGENPTVGAMNSFANLYRRFVSKEQKFIATSCGEGGKSIEQLSKECTNGTNYYNKQFMETLTRTKATVDALNKTVGCFAILFMQGEYNYTNLSGGGLTPGTDATNDKDTYKQYLLTLKNNMQADIMAQYGQSKKPLFLLYEVAGFFINLKNMSINMAQIEFAQENDDVFLLAPTYPVPDYGGGHLSTNGYRWYGEMMAKSLYNIFINGVSFYSIMPEKFEIVNDNTIRIDFHVPVLPLVFDTYTKESITDYGFKLIVDDDDANITFVNIKNNSVLLKTDTSLNGKKVELTYAGQGRNGSGNLRDSDTYHSLYNYYDDRITSPSKRENYTPKDKNGNYIYGKPYPMFNWCGNFYKLIQSSNV